MITLNQLVFRIIALYRAAYKNTDHISERLIKNWIHTTRAMLVKQRLDKPMAVIDESLVQVISPAPLEEVDSSTFEGVSSDRTIIRTKNIIPATINRRGLIGTFTRIGPVDRMDKRYKIVSHETALFSGSGKFNRQDIYAFPLDNRIYLYAREIDPHGLLDIRGVFQNPEEVPGFDPNGPYPINNELVDTMEDMIVKMKFHLTLSGLKDDIANEEDDLVNPQNKQQQRQR
jgi:hypothetical protein